MPNHRVKIPTSIAIGVTKDGVVKLWDADTELTLTRYQTEKFLDEVQPEVRMMVDALKAKLQAAKRDRRQRWLNGEPWEPLDIAELTSGFDALARIVGSLDSPDRLN